MNTVFAGALTCAQFCLVAAMAFSAFRLLRGPSAHDRVLALDSLNMNCMLTLLILGMRSSSTVYFDMALLMGVFGFVGSTAVAKFLLRGEVIEP